MVSIFHLEVFLKLESHHRPTLSEPANPMPVPAREAPDTPQVLRVEGFLYVVIKG
jgi:hypothetical protein